MGKTNLRALPKLRDSISYVYAEHAIIEQDDHSIVMICQDGRIPIPVSSTTCILLGPGTNITHAAVKTAAENGCTSSLRGEIRKWMLEGKPGVFLAKMSAIVRDALWEKVKHDLQATGAILAYSAPTEIGFIMQMHGIPTRSIVDLEGLQLIKIQ